VDARRVLTHSQVANQDIRDIRTQASRWYQAGRINRDVLTELQTMLDEGRCPPAVQAALFYVTFVAKSQSADSAVAVFGDAVTAYEQRVMAWILGNLVPGAKTSSRVDSSPGSIGSSTLGLPSGVFSDLQS